MSDNLNLTLTLRATDRGLTGTVREARDGVGQLDDQLGKTSQSTRQFAKHTRDADKSTDGFAKRMAGGAIGAAQWALAIGGAATALTGYIVATNTDAIRQTDMFAQSLNMSTQTMTEWQYASEQMGLSGDGLQQVFQDVQDKLGDLTTTGGGEAVDLFENLNLQMDELITLSPDKQLLAIADAMDGINQNQKVFFMESLASDSTRLLPLLQDNAAELRRLQLEAQVLGVSISDIDAAKVTQAGQAMDRTKGLMGGLANEITIELAPVLTGVSNLLVDNAVEAGGFGDAVRTTVDGAVTGIGFVLDVGQQLLVWSKHAQIGMMTLGQYGTGAMASIADTTAAVINLSLYPFQQTIAWIIEQVSSLVELGSRFGGPFADSFKDASEWLGTFSNEVKQFEVQGADIVALNERMLAGLSTAATELDALLNANAPSEDLKSWVQKLREESEQAAQAQVDLRNQQQQTGKIVGAGVDVSAYEQLNKALKEELELMQLTAEQRAVEVNLRKLGADATDEQKKQIENLTKELYQAQQKTNLTEPLEQDFERMANRVAQTLQDSIAAGDWQGVGVAVGAVLAGEIGAAVSREMAASLESQLGAQMAGIAGAFGGAVVGGLLTYLLTDPGTELKDDSEWRQAQQGTGTVLGDIAAQSESIANATDITAGATRDLVGINRDMLRALQSVQAGISGASTLIARDAGNVQFAEFDAPTAPVVSAVDNLLTNNSLNWLTGGVLGRVADYFGGSSKITDQGIRISGGRIGRLRDDVNVDAYQDTSYKTWKYGKTRKRTDYADLSSGVEAQFALVFDSIADSVLAGAEAIGLAGSEVESAINQYGVGTTQISLRGLSSSAQRAQIQAVFSRVFDGLSGAVIPWLSEFQVAGEGLGETLSRVATSVQVAQEAQYRLGFIAENETAQQFAMLSVELLDAAGGIDQFISGMSSFVDVFAPAEHRAALASADIARAFEQVGLAVPVTREGMWELMQTLDAGTESGRSQIAALLELTDTADAYYSMLEESGQQLQAVVGEALGADALGQYFADLSDYISAESAVIESDYRDRIALLQEQGRVAKELQAYTQKLRLSDLSPYDPSDKLSAASDQFAALLVRAEAGDLEAAAQLQSAADTYLKNADSYYGRTDAYTSVFEDVASALDGLGLDLAAGSSEVAIEQLNAQMLAEQQALTDYAQQELSWAVAQYESLNSIDQLLGVLPDEIAAVLSPADAGDSVVVAPIRPDGSHKTGLVRVPFDGYIAELHKGERVLTAPEAQAYSSSGVVDVQPLVAELQQLRAEVAALRSERSADAGKAAQQRTGQQRSLDQVARQGRKPVGVL